jgi:hypothetical protein
MERNSSGADENQQYSVLADLIDEQYQLSRELYALTESQRRLVRDMASRPAGIARAQEATEIKIRATIDRLCELRDEIKRVHIP